jgi:hypothetical protein
MNAAAYWLAIISFVPVLAAVPVHYIHRPALTASNATPVHWQCSAPVHWQCSAPVHWQCSASNHYSRVLRGAGKLTV